MKLSNTAIKELSAKYRSILHKCAFLNAIILGVAFSTGVLADEGTITIIHEEGADPTTYSDPTNEFVAVVNNAIGNNVKYITTGSGVTEDVAGIYTTTSTSADSITNGINLKTTDGAAFGICALGGTTDVKGLGGIAVQGATSYGIDSEGDDEDFENNITFANGGTISSISTGTGHDDEAFGISAADHGKTKVEGLGAIIVKAEKTASGIFIMTDYSDFENSVEFVNGGTISSESKTSVAQGITFWGYGTSSVSNLQSITTSSKNDAFGIYSMGADNNFTNSIEFSNDGTITSTSTNGAAYGIVAGVSGTTTVSSENGGGTIKVSGSNASAKIYMGGDAIVNLIGFNLTKSENEEDVFTIKSGTSTGETATLNLTNTIVAGKVDTTSASGKLNMYVKNDSSLKLNDIQFTGASDSKLSVLMNGGAIDLRNNAISATTLPSFLTFKSGTSHIYADVDLASETMDTLFKDATTTLESGAQINVSKLNLLSDATKQSTTITFTTDSDLISAITDWETGISYSYSPKYIYDVTYDNGEFTFTQHTNEVNPSLYASSTVSQTVGLLQSDIVNVAFDGLNTGNSAKFSEKTGDDTPKDNAWVKVIGVDDNVDFDSFKTVDSEMFSLMAGMNTKDIKVGSADMKFGFYAGYLNGEQKYTDNKIEQDGGYLGLSTSWTKGNIVLNGTINGGFMNNEAENTFGTDKYDTFWTGVGIKAGYNYDLGSALTLQPNVYAGYTLVDTEDYTSKSGVRIKNDKTHLFEVAPGFKLSKDFQNYWKGYAQAKYAVLADKGGDVNADDLALPNISADNYAEYGIGVEKTFNNDWGMSLTANRRDGGRQGWNGSLEFKYNF